VKLKVKLIDIAVGLGRYVVINEEDAKELSIKYHDRITFKHGKGVSTAIAFITSSLIPKGYIGITKDLQYLVSEGEEVDVMPARPPESTKYIRQKLKGEKLTEDQIFTIIRDIVNFNLSEIEMASFILAQELRGMSIDEVVYLTKAMVETGKRLKFPEPTYDVHSIGGVPGNSKVSLVMIPTIAAAGVFIPKTSSRAITSPAGTADTMEVLARVDFTIEEIKELAKKVNGFIVWGGRLNLAPADDILIRVEHVLRVDPRTQMIASILSKKLAMGAESVVIDIPTGEGAKVRTMEEARELASQFIQVGSKVGLKIRCAITYGGQPIGYTIGPALEAKEALEALRGGGAMSLVEKAVSVAGMVLELAGAAPKGAGYEVAKDILRSGKSLEMMKRIIEAQGGNPNVKPEDIPVGKYHVHIESPVDGYVTHVSNEGLTIMARTAGAPFDKGAGIRLYVKRGHKVRKGDKLLTIYSNSSVKLNEALKLFYKLRPIVLEGMLLEKFPEEY